MDEQSVLLSLSNPEGLRQTSGQLRSLFFLVEKLVKAILKASRLNTGGNFFFGFRFALLDQSVEESLNCKHLSGFPVRSFILNPTWFAELNPIRTENEHVRRDATLVAIYALVSHTILSTGAGLVSTVLPFVRPKPWTPYGG